ncbi:MAG: efflux RND transporter periplasmic adaptor subunit [Chloroflexia bacterium]|nr:efflux RND transporter periplasmic adaptor subunit [Chloroflexia bacterium]
MQEHYILIALGAAILGFALLALLAKSRWLKRISGVLFLIALMAGIVLGLRYQRERDQPDPLADGEVYTVLRGEVRDMVEASGNLSPVSQVPLAFALPGELVEIRVATGERVRQGQVLARLDSTDLELQLAQAQAGLDLARANMDKLLAGPVEEDLTVAQSSLNQAAASRDDSRVSLSAATEQARLSWEMAANNLRDAQANYENIYWDNRDLENRLNKYGQDLPDARVDQEAQAWRAVENAEAAMEQARLSYEQALQREQSSNQSAQAQVVSAQANLGRLQSGAGAEDVRISQLSIDQAQVSYDLAFENLKKSALRAPFDGIVATVLAEVHNQVSAANTILVLIDDSSYTIDVEVDEIDIPAIQVEQECIILLDALPEAELVGRVREVALSPSVGQGIVTYRVRVEVTDLGGAAVRPGMTANVNIVTARAEGVLVVPRRAVQIEEGQAYVERLTADDQLEKIPVELGLGDAFSIEIVSGLQEGDRLFVRGVVQRNQIQDAFPFR